MAIRFFVEETKFKLTEKNQIKRWLKVVANNENFSIGELVYIFCTDEYLRNINVTYLNHDTYTDIITFDNSEQNGIIEGEIYISIERIKENAYQLKEPFERELKRVLSHGLLHLCGYKDKSKKESQLMRKKEDEAISIYNQ